MPQIRSLTGAKHGLEKRGNQFGVQPLLPSSPFNPCPSGASLCEAGSDWGRQIDHPASNHEHAFPLVMNRAVRCGHWRRKVPGRRGAGGAWGRTRAGRRAKRAARRAFGRATRPKAKGKGRIGKRGSLNSQPKTLNHSGLVQQRIDSTLRATTPPKLRTSPTRSGRFNPLVVRLVAGAGFEPAIPLCGIMSLINLAVPSTGENPLRPFAA
jgi:hypothetical protein